MNSNRPHGGRLINRILEGKAREEWLQRAALLPRVRLNARQMADVEMIAVGAFSPLEGFMGSRDYESVLCEERLANGVVWTIPVTLGVTEDTKQAIGTAEAVALTDAEARVVAVLDLEEIFRYDREREAQSVLRTTENSHPGVRYLETAGEYCLAGPIHLLERRQDRTYENYRLDPIETRYLFAHHGWKTVVAFQTRNPVHRAHEYILKCALETVDGLLLHPLVGDTQDGDVPAEVRIQCYLRRRAPSSACIPRRCAMPGRARPSSTQLRGKIMAARISLSGAIMRASATFTDPSTRRKNSSPSNRMNLASRRSALTLLSIAGSAGRLLPKRPARTGRSTGWF